MEQVYTMDQWYLDKEFKAKVGQQVANDVVWELIEAVPPAYWSGGLFQVGEPKDGDAETGANLYDTFTHDGDGENWIYRGTCLRGKTEHRKGYYESHVV